MERGLIHIYTGDGKGKTTAAFGLAMRAAGWHRRVLIVQFCKNTPSGEYELAQKLGIDAWRAEQGTTRFFGEMTGEEKAVWLAGQRALFDRANRAAREGDYDLLVMDEALGAMACGVMSEAELAETMRGKSDRLELVLTGRGAPEGLIALADYVTDMCMLRHPYEKGVNARRGVEF